MTEVYFPRLAASAQAWRLLGQGVRNFDPLRGSSQVVTRPGAKWSADLTFSDFSSVKRDYIDAAAVELDGFVNTARIYDTTRQVPTAGNIAQVDNQLLQGDAETAADVSAWTQGANCSIALAAPYLRTTLTGSTAGLVRQNMDGLNAARYALRGYFAPGNGAGTFTTRIGTTAGGAETMADLAMTSAGYFFRDFTADAADNYLSLGLSGGGTVDDFGFYAGVSVSRCGRVMGAGQTGTILNIDSIPTDTANVLSVGDYIELRTSGDVFPAVSQLHRITKPVDSRGAGEAVALHIAPALTTAPADNEPVAFYRASELMRLAGADVARSDRAPVLSGLTLSFVSAA